MGSSGSPDAIAVIGAGYGDEGKGLVTDALSSSSTRVVRFNGGAQAGHTVCATGRRHVFHHMGSGTFQGASTHLSRFFVVNPILAIREWKELGIPLTITVDPRCPITVPIDMMINQALEQKRGAARHGSCGIGFGETIERTERGFELRVKDIAGGEIRNILGGIALNWALSRCDELGLDAADLPYKRDIDEQFMTDLREFLGRVEVREDSEIAAGVDRLVFEGAQGLGLDQDLGEFPHVTRSHTGLPNVLTLARDAGIEHISVAYVTRCYATRHGAGPLARENEWSGARLKDETNVANDWQGALRYAPLDIQQRRRWIEQDLFRCRGRNAVAVNRGLVMTCLDHAAAMLPASRILSRTMADALDLPLWATSCGPGREDFRMFEGLRPS